jgi:hypothetical protein
LTTAPPVSLFVQKSKTIDNFHKFKNPRRLQ